MLQDKDRIFTNLYGYQSWRVDAAMQRGDWDNTKALLDLGQEPFPLLAQVHTLALPIEQLHAIAGFQLPQMRRHRGLADPQLLGSLGNRATMGGGVKGLQFQSQHAVALLAKTQSPNYPILVLQKLVVLS